MSALLCPDAFLSQLEIETDALVDDYLQQARQAWARKEPDKALELAGKAIAADPKDARGYLLRGTLREALLLWNDKRTP